MERLDAMAGKSGYNREKSASVPEGKQTPALQTKAENTDK